jgi:hypothetical protein
MVSNGWPMIIPKKFEIELASTCPITNFKVIFFGIK